MVLIEFVLLITQALLYVLQSTIWSLLGVSFSVQNYVFRLFWEPCSKYEWIYWVFPLIMLESLRYLSMYDNRCLRYFKGHKDRFGLVNIFKLSCIIFRFLLCHFITIWVLSFSTEGVVYANSYQFLYMHVCNGGYVL